MLLAECVNLGEKSCSLNDLGPAVDVQVTVTSEENTNNPTSYLISNTTADHIIFSGKQGEAFVFDRSSTSASVVLLLRDHSSDEVYIAYGIGQISSSTGRFAMNPPLRLWPSAIASNTSNLKEALVNHFPKYLVAYAGPTITVFLDFLVRFAYGYEPLTWQAYRTREENVTQLSTYAIILLCLLLLAVLALWLLRGLLHLYFVDKKRVSLAELRCTDLDELSRTLRRELERTNKVEPSSEFALLGTHYDERGSNRVGFIAPLDHTSSSSNIRDFDNAEDETARRVGQAVLSQAAAFKDDDTSSIAVTLPVTVCLERAPG